MDGQEKKGVRQRVKRVDWVNLMMNGSKAEAKREASRLHVSAAVMLPIVVEV